MVRTIPYRLWCDDQVVEPNGRVVVRYWWVPMMVVTLIGVAVASPFVFSLLRFFIRGAG